MNKKEFITFLASERSISQKQASEIVEYFTDAVTKVLAKQDEVSLIGFGNFYVNEVSAREGRNPQTGAKITIPSFNQPRFKVGAKLKQACNK